MHISMRFKSQTDRNKDLLKTNAYYTEQLRQEYDEWEKLRSRIQEMWKEKIVIMHYESLNLGINPTGIQLGTPTFT